MISAFNRSQVVWGVFGLAGSVVCYGLAWLFFEQGAEMVLDACALSTRAAPWTALLALACISFSGWRTWESGQGFQSYSESAFYHDFGGGAETAGNHRGAKMTGLAYVLSQAFLAGPLLLLRSLHRLQNLVPDEAGLEQKLVHLLAMLRAANKWQGLADYPGQEREVLLLNLMKKIDFSRHNGNVRFKARTFEGI